MFKTIFKYFLLSLLLISEYALAETPSPYMLTIHYTSNGTDFTFRTCANGTIPRAALFNTIKSGNYIGNPKPDLITFTKGTDANTKCTIALTNTGADLDSIHCTNASLSVTAKKYAGASIIDVTAKY